MPDPHCQEDLGQRMEEQEALLKAKALRSREYVPAREEMEVNLREEEKEEVVREGITSGAAKSARRKQLQKLALRDDRAESFRRESIFR